jgi:RimJ/RimL family protein N-acetyltransferase
MMAGARVILRDRRRDDVAVLHAAFDADPAMHAVVDETPWRPVSLDRRLAEHDRRLTEPADPATVGFTVALRDDPESRCIGMCSLWGLDQHSRWAHLGISLVAAARGTGAGRDAVALLSEYAFVHRGLHRLQLETLASNAAMQAVARACGFVEEGRRREVAFVTGAFEDELVFGLLAAEWRARRGAAG